MKLIRRSRISCRLYREVNCKTHRTMSRTMIILLVALAIFSTRTFATSVVCDRKNEEYQCGSACQTTCENVGKPCPIINIRCNDNCYCKKGYARNGSYTDSCIPISECPYQKK